MIGVPLPKKPKFAKTGLSLEQDAMDAAQARARLLGFQNFSAYVAALVQKDLHTPDGWLQIPPKRPKK